MEGRKVHTQKVFAGRKPESREELDLVYNSIGDAEALAELCRARPSMLEDIIDAALRVTDPRPEISN